MSIQQTHFTDTPAPHFDHRKADKTSRRRLGLYETQKRDRHMGLRARFQNHGADHLSDAEMLELMLLHSSPRKDTQPLAKKVLAEFGVLASILAADNARLEAIIGVVAAQDLKLVYSASKRLAKARITHRPLISSWDAVLNYCRTTLAHKETEEFHVLFLDRRNMLIADEVMGVGTVDHVPVYPREVLKRALELNACAFILPSGDPAPSESDIEMTQLIKQAADSLSITLHDHLIIGASGETSFVSKGLL
ncbi:DNA repair protein RadC [Planktotalea sp.]|uniref:RadC family protein n=1 Tax=Planktotalea sp. TaxID=2029877 RepID=UPI0025F5E77E|nr:DNA repair protein RadC [Planktotalea sp.]